MDAKSLGSKQKERLIVVERMKVKFLAVALTLVGIGSLFLVERNSSAVSKSQEENPGFMEQFIEMKQNERGEVPKMKWKEWAEATSKMHGKVDFFSTVNELGPSNIGGRTRTMIVDAANSNHLIAGAASGGIWISNNRGLNWTPLDDDAQALSVTGITQNPFNAQEIYYSTGELSTGAEVNYNGDGIFRSADGGQTFKQIPGSGDIAAFNKTWDIEYSKTDSNTFYVATISGGLYRTQDKGESFEQIYKDGFNAINDVDAMDNGTIHFTVERKGVYWFKEVEGPITVNKHPISITGSYTRVLVEFADTDTSILYASFAGTDRNSLKNIFKSTDAGETWTALQNPTNSFNFTWYCFMLEVAPDDPNYVIIGAQYASYSTNGGNSWTGLRDSHADYHGAAFIPNSSQYFVYNDGGIYQYARTTANLLFVDRNSGYNCTQFYAGSFYPNGTQCLVGAQDNWTTTNVGGGSVFTQVYGGDGAFNAIDSTGQYMYASAQRGNLIRYNASSGTWSSVYSTLVGAVGTGFWFINPFEINPSDGQQIYFPSRNYLGRSIDRGTRWTRITNRIDGNIFSVAMTKEDNPTLYFGGKEGLLYRIDSAKTAIAGNSIEFNANDRPIIARNGFIGNIEIDPNNPTTLFIPFANSDGLPRVWKVERADSANATWTNISGNLPTGLPVNWLEVDPKDSDHLMAATDYGLYVTENGGRFWHKEERIPNVYIPMIRLRESDRKLFIFTYGRGVWTADLKSDIIASTPSVQQKSFSFYPNPAHDQVRVNAEGVIKAHLIGLNGQSIELDALGDRTYDLSGVTPGIYVLSLTTDSGALLNQKLVVQ